MHISLNYSDSHYFDAEDVTISTSDFGSLSSSAQLDLILPPSNDTEVINFTEYFIERGYVADKNIRAAPYDWRLGGSKSETMIKQITVCMANC